MITDEMVLKRVVQVMVSEAKPALDPSVFDKNKKDAKELTRFKSVKKVSSRLQAQTVCTVFKIHALLDLL
jgi:hypothetical protein